PDPRWGCAALVPIVQAQTGLPVQPCRLYDEFAAHWLAWYFGWPAVLLAVAGLALLVHRAVRDADLRLLRGAGVPWAMCAVSLVHARITRDQVWAMRRYLPVVLPGLLGAAVYLLSRLWDGCHPAGRRWRQWARRAVGGLAVLLVAIPAFITHPMELVREDAGQFGQVRALCRQVGESAAVLAGGGAAAAPDPPDPRPPLRGAARRPGGGPRATP